jgi:hypothetical protein
VRWALTQYGTLGGRRDFTPFTNPPGERGETG